MNFLFVPSFTLQGNTLYKMNQKLPWEKTRTTLGIKSHAFPQLHLHYGIRWTTFIWNNNGLWTIKQNHLSDLWLLPSGSETSWRCLPCCHPKGAELEHLHKYSVKSVYLARWTESFVLGNLLLWHQVKTKSIIYFDEVIPGEFLIFYILHA